MTTSGALEPIMYDALVSTFGVRVLWATETPQPTDPDNPVEGEEEYGGNSINDPNPSGNPDEDN